MIPDEEARASSFRSALHAAMATARTADAKT